MRRFIYTATVLLVALSSCVTVISTGRKSTLPLTTGSAISPLPFAKLYTSVWMQRAAEYKGLCLQAYNLAELRLEEALRNPANYGKKLAIVTDIDETFLDNSPNAVHQALADKLYESDSWHQWCAMADADTLPGSLRFFHKAADAGVEVYYISNRTQKDRVGTLANLRKFGYPYADDAHLLLRTTSSNKDSRRAQVLKEYEVILYLGDNLGDFTSDFDKGTEADRQAALYRVRQDIGRKFILLPNPNYGNWESALMDYRRDMTLRQQEKVFVEKAKRY